MSMLAAVRGQSAAIGVLENAVARGRLASAYMFFGPSGVGKERTALALAVDRIAQGDETLSRRILGGNHPDVRVFRPRDEGSRNIQVELVRSEILPFTQFAPFEADSAFVIFPEADVSFPDFSPESANALLKTLEEPRPNLTFILLAERPNRLLATIRSRCQPLRFAPLSNDILDAILAAEGIDESARPGAIALARGRANRALELARSGKVDSIFERALELHRLVRKDRIGDLYGASERMTKLEDDDQALDLEALALLYRDLALASVGAPDAALAFRSQANAVKSESKNGTSRGYGYREAALRRCIDLLASGNANVQVVLDALFFDLARVV